MHIPDLLATLLAFWPRSTVPTSSHKQLPGHRSPELVKRALTNLDSPGALELNPLAQLPMLSSRRSAADLRALLVDVVAELSDSRIPRDAEAGRLLLDYYVKRVGTHEVTMARLNMSRPTYYRRLREGYVLVAQQLSRLSEFAVRFPD